jgi:N-acetylgalactosamine-6-sulfatase
MRLTIKLFFSRFIALILFGAGLACFVTSTAKAGTKGVGEKTNIIFIFCDDLGFGDLGCYGNNKIKTPHIDRMASEGVLFTNFTVASPVCSPSRVGMMTGQYPSRLRFHGHLASIKINGERGMPNYLDANNTTITKLLKSFGYATGHFGKWHMGGPQDKNAPSPENYGIDVSATVLSNGPHYNKDGDKRANSSFRIMQHTIDFVQTNANKPFFVNCWLVDPHSVLVPNKEQLDEYPELKSRAKGFTSATQTYSAVVTNIDKQVGRLFDKLKELGISENTLVVFSSDNGPAPIWGIATAHSGTGSVGPLRGCKASLYEGGIRVPFIVHWPGHVPERKVDDSTIISGVDLLPTFCSIAGLQLSEELDLDGQDMSEAFKGIPVERTSALMWEYRYSPWGRHIQKSPMLAMREGNWKLMMNADGSRLELYNLKENPCEVDNLVNEYPKIVKKMSRELLSWHWSLPDKEFIPESGGSFDYPWPGKNKY